MRLRLRPETILALSACAAAAVWIDLGRLHRSEDGDSMLTVLISLQRWTPYLWEQDRFGTLVPLLAMPFRDPLVNLLVQRGLYLFAGLCSFLAVARWAFGPERWALLGLSGAALWVGLMPFAVSFGYLGDEPYALSLLLGTCALLAAEGPWRREVRWPAAAALMLLSHWINFSIFAFLAPAAVGRGAALAFGRSGEARRAPLMRGLREAGWSLGGAGALWTVNRLAGVRHATALHPVPVEEWPHAWAQLGRQLWAGQAPQWLFWSCLAAGVAGAVGMARSPRWREGAADAARTGLGLLAAGAGYFLVAGLQSHVVANDSLIRYLYPALPPLELSLLALAVLPAAQSMDGRAFRAACGVAAAGVLAGSALTFGAPAPASIRPDLEAVSPVTAEVIALRCTHVAGRYWTVWPAVVMANAERYRRGEPGAPVYGLTDRARATLDLASAVPPEALRVAVPAGDAEAAGWLREYHFPELVPVERGRQITVFAVAPAAPH